MSHTTAYEQKVTDVGLFAQVCEKLGHKVKVASGNGLTVNHYGSNQEANCVAEIHMTGWRYPIAVKEDGSLLYDHWGSAPETMNHLKEAMQNYYQNLVMKNIDHTVVKNNYMTAKSNGDVVITLEY